LLYIAGVLRKDEDVLWMMSTSGTCCPNNCFRKLSIEEAIENLQRRLKTALHGWNSL